jgi:hypothetical protein
MASMIVNQAAASIRASFERAVFGVSGPAGRRGCSLDDVRALSQEFSLAAPLGGGGAMLAIQALGHQPCHPRASLCR